MKNSANLIERITIIAVKYGETAIFGSEIKESICKVHCFLYTRLKVLFFSGMNTVSELSINMNNPPYLI